MIVSAALSAALAAYDLKPFAPLPVRAATISVNSPDDTAVAADGDCTLREAINNAEADADTTGGDCLAGSGEDLISFDGVTEITLTGNLPDIDDGDGLTIDGGDTVTISGDGTFNPFEVNDGASLTLRDITVTEAFGAQGAAVNNEGTVSLIGTTITASSASLDGGAVFNDCGAVLSLAGSTISNNSAIALGGGIANCGVLTLAGSTVSGNSAGEDGGGIASVIGDLILMDSAVTDNSAGGGGGGISSSGGSEAAVVSLDNVVVSGNSARSGGGISGGGAAVIINNSTVSNNSASSSGGGLAIAEDTLDLNSSIVSHNSAGGSGAGIIVFFAVADLTNSTVSGNSSGNNGGGLHSDAGSTVRVVNSTISENAALGAGGGLYLEAESSLTLRNVIVAENDALDCSGEVTSLSHNLDSDGSCLDGSVSGDIVNGNANLGPLGNNGGPTDTHALLAGSDAIDMGANAVCVDQTDGSAPFDQRGPGFDRIQNGVCDMGAFEVQEPDPLPTATLTRTPRPTRTPGFTSEGPVVPTSMPTRLPTAMPPPPPTATPQPAASVGVVTPPSTGDADLR